MTDFKNISVNWNAFNNMNDIQKNKALQNLLATLDVSDYSFSCALLSLHASGLINIEFYNPTEEGDWNYWAELLEKTYSKE